MDPVRYGGASEHLTLDVGAYLQRIDYAGPAPADYITLRALHLAQLYAVPFENLDVHLRRPIVLNERLLFEKIVTQRRGGFCYELNGLFAWLLREVGFDVTYLSAQVAQGNDPYPGEHTYSKEFAYSREYAYSSEFDHLVLQVRTPADCSRVWLADVGFGDSFLEPLDLQNTEEQIQDGHAYWLESEGEHTVLWRRTQNGSAEPQYRFTLQPWTFSDFESQCEFTQTSPDSSFTQERICTLPIPNGRVSLTDSELITTVNGRREEHTVRDETERTVLLRDYFGVDLSGGDR